jgi:hypothetical protein
MSTLDTVLTLALILAVAWMGRGVVILVALAIQAASVTTLKDQWESEAAIARAGPVMRDSLLQGGVVAGAILLTWWLT